MGTLLGLVVCAWVAGFAAGMMFAALAGEAGTAATVKQGAVHEHATAQPERPNPTPILPKKEIPL